MGAAVARLAATEGARVFIAALTPEGCESLAAEIKGGWFAGDLSVERNARAAVDGCVAHFGRIDGVFNVAGISGRRFGDGPLHECSAEGWDTLMSINLRSLFLISREVVRQMLAAEHAGSIVNMGSVVALSPEPRHFASHAYATSKGAIHAFTIATAAYYAASGIRYQCGRAGPGGNANESPGAAESRDSGVHGNKTTACEGIYDSRGCRRRRRIFIKR